MKPEIAAARKVARERFAGNLRGRRRAFGLSIHELARTIGFSYEAVMRWENGHHKPGPATVERVARALGCKPEVLTG